MEDLRRRLDGRYAIQRELGRGGMGAVYLATDLRLDRPVALKVLPIRLYAQEAGTLRLVLFFVGLIAWLIYQINKLQDLSSIDAALPVVLLLAMSLARVLQAVRGPSENPLAALEARVAALEEWKTRTSR